MSYHRGVWNTRANTWVIGPWLDVDGLNEEDVVGPCSVCGAAEGEKCRLPGGLETARFIHAARFGGFDPREALVEAVRRYQEAHLVGGLQAITKAREDLWEQLVELDLRNAADARARKQQEKAVRAKKGSQL